MNDIERRARLNRIQKLRNFRPILPPFPPGTIPERVKTNEDLWVEAQGYVPFVNIQLLHHLPIFVQAFFPTIRNINIPFAVPGKRATLHELHRVINIYKKHIRDERIYKNPKAQHCLHGFIYYRTNNERYYYDKEAKPLRVETNYASPPAPARLTIDGAPLTGDLVTACEHEGKLNE